MNLHSVLVHLVSFSDMQKQLVRPRYLPGVEVQSIKGLADPLLQSVHAAGHLTYNAFCIAAARKDLGIQADSAECRGLAFLLSRSPEVPEVGRLGNEDMPHTGVGFLGWLRPMVRRRGRDVLFALASRFCCHSNVSCISHG